MSSKLNKKMLERFATPPIISLIPHLGFSVFLIDIPVS